MIDERAVVAPGAQLAEGVSVGAFSVIGDGVSIGARTEIGAHVVIEGPTTIGEDNRVFPFTTLGTEPQDKKYAGEPTRLTIGDRNTIRECCTFNRGTTQDRGVTRVGNDNWIMAYVHVAHDCDVGHHVILANNSTLAGHVSVGDHAILGGFTKVHQFCRVGAHAFCGMDSGLNRDVPPYVTAAGHLAVPKGINSEGLKRRGFTSAQVRNIRQAYRVLYRSDLKQADALAELKRLAAEQPEIAPLATFVEQSERGIIR